MTKELCSVIDQISREKGISREALVKVLEAALLSAARKKYGGRTNINLRIDAKTCDIQVFETKKVAEKITNKDEEISEEEASKTFPDVKIGDEIELPIQLQDFGRIAAQTAKQVLFQRVREAERDIIFDEFKDKSGQIISGTVLRKERNVYYISLGKAEAVMLQREALPSETLKRGDMVKAYLSEVRQTAKGPAIMLSRTDPNFIVGLFKMEVPEINDGVVVIKGIAREPGDRTKIAVFSKDSSIDAVGACVGMKGTRVQSIVRELRGERIDIIPWSEDPRIFIARAQTAIQLALLRFQAAEGKQGAEFAGRGAIVTSQVEGLLEIRPRLGGIAFAHKCVAQVDQPVGGEIFHAVRARQLERLGGVGLRFSRVARVGFEPAYLHRYQDLLRGAFGGLR